MRGGASDGVSKDLQEGLTTYAEGQADIQKSLHEHFCMLWGLPFVGNDESGERLGDDDDDDGDGDEEVDGSDSEGEDAEDEEDEEDEF